MLKFHIIFLVVLITSQVGSSFKCKFKAINDPATPGYICYIQQFEGDEVHSSGKTDNDIRMVGFKMSLTHLSQSEYPFCQRFPGLKMLSIDNMVSIDPKILENCKNLTLVDVSDNDIQEVPEDFYADSTKIEFLSLGSNKLTTLPENIFVHQEMLRSLSLSKNQIASLPPNIFKTLTTLKDIFLDNNKIKILQPAWFETLKSLRVFSANNNEISDLPVNVFSSLEGLEYLNLDDNQLTTIHSDSFGHIQKLSRISLMDNNVNAVDRRIIENTSVDGIKLFGNECADKFVNVKKNPKELEKCFQNYQARGGKRS